MNEFMKRVVMPAMVPVVSLAVIVVVVFNLSRILIGLHDNNGPRWVVVFATILGLIMFGGFIYYSSNQARREGNGAVLASFGIAFVFLGFLGAELIQAHEHHGEEEGPALGPPAVTIIAVDNDFPEKSFTIPQGEVIGYKNEGNALHTLLAEGAPAFEKLTVATNGAEARGVVDLEPGDYIFFCDVPGHRASGMEATVTVTPAGSGGGGTGGEAGGAEGGGAEGGGAEGGGQGGQGGAGGGGGGAAAGSVEIVSTQDITFEPSQLTAPAGSKITLKNQGALPHDFTLEGVPSFEPLVVSSDGETDTGTLNVDPGEYVFFCSVPGHRQIGMEGTLTVTGGG